MSSKFTSFLLVLIVFCTGLFLARGQEFIRGRLLDSKTEEPIVFASIYLENINRGVISNLDGGFKIPMRYREIGDSLVISSMGYRQIKRSIFDFSPEKTNIIRLEPALFELQEAVVKARKPGMSENLTAKAIVRRAIKGISENYPTKPFSQVGYYRDYQLDRSEYVNLNEAILETFDQGFKAVDSSTTRVLLYEYKENANFRRDTLTRKPYDYNFKGGAKIVDNAYLPSHGGNEFVILNVHNAIRNYKIDTYSYVHRLENDLLKQHEFSVEDDSYLNDQLLYTIRFEKTLPNYKAHGRLFISKQDYSIYKMEYAVYHKNTSKTLLAFRKDKNKEQLVFEVSTEYRKRDGKMFLSYISFHNAFKVWEPPKLVLEYVGLNYNRQCFVLNFNNELSSTSAEQIKNYEIRFKRKKVKITTLVVFENQVFLYPKLDKKKVFEKIVENAKEVGLKEVDLNIKIRNIKDVEENMINEWSSKRYNQFREFFVQQVKPNGPFRSYSDMFYMNKKKPIFSDQPTVKPDNFDDYWMNTPLKNIDN